MAVQSDKLRLLRRIPQIRFEEELRGYSKSQVDRVLENLAPLADEIEALQQRLAEAEQRAASAEAAAVQSGAPAPAVLDTTPAPLPQPPEDFDSQLREVMLMAQRTAKERVETAEADAEKIRGESKANADSLMASARTEANELKGEAHAQREQMLSEAEEERATRLEAANAEAEERRQAVEAQLLESEGALREDLLVEIKELRDKRARLAEDLALFENHIGNRREAVKAALGEIDDAINDPDKLRENPILEMVSVSETDESELSEISVESEALQELSGEAARARNALAAAAIAPVSLSTEDEVGGTGETIREEAAQWTPPEVVNPSAGMGADSDAWDLESTGAVETVPGMDTGPVDLSGETPIPDHPLPDGPPLTEAVDLGFSPDSVPAARTGFFDSGMAGDDVDQQYSWDAPEPEAESESPEQPAPPPQETARGGLLSGLLGGRRSADPVPEADPGEYLPPPSAESPESQAMSGLRHRMTGGAAAGPAQEMSDLPPDSQSLAQAAMRAVTESGGDGGEVIGQPGNDAGAQFGEPLRDGTGSHVTETDSRPPWAEAIPDDSASRSADDLGVGSSDQYLDELRRVTGEDAVADESDDALNRFLSEDDDEGGGWFGRRR